MNFLAGKNSGLLAIKIKNCAFIGFNAGADVIEADGLVIIGDDIRKPDKNDPNQLWLGDKVIIGRMLFGERLNLMEILRDQILHRPYQG